eukprot:365334-Chlamydomonas_euryale.AAC.2
MSCRCEDTMSIPTSRKISTCDCVKWKLQPYRLLYTTCSVPPALYCLLTGWCCGMLSAGGPRPSARAPVRPSTRGTAPKTDARCCCRHLYAHGCRYDSIHAFLRHYRGAHTVLRRPLCQAFRMSTGATVAGVDAATAAAAAGIARGARRSWAEAGAKSDAAGKCDLCPVRNRVPVPIRVKTHVQHFGVGLLLDAAAQAGRVAENVWERP